MKTHGIIVSGVHSGMDKVVLAKAKPFKMLDNKSTFFLK